MLWHLAPASNAPLDPGPVDATPPVTAVTDPASFPTPVSQYAAVSYQSMPSPAPYAPMSAQPTYAPAPPQGTYLSAPAQGGLAAPMASPYANPAPYGALDLVLPPEAGKVVKTVVTAKRIFSVIFVLAIVGTFTVVGFSQGGSSTWMIVGFAWSVGIVMLAGMFMLGRVRMGRRA